MAKCPICDSRKGKRKCLIADSMICSQCCGATRDEAACTGCAFFQKPKRNYNDVPAYSVSDMDGNLQLETYGNIIEGTLCAYDASINNQLNDSNAIRVIELLMDKYHFQDQQLDQENPIVVNGVYAVDQAILDDLQNVEHTEIVKVLGVIRFVARRRTKAGREYMNVIHQYVGQRLESGVRLMNF